MENIPHAIFSPILCSALFVTLFIYATFEILALFLHRRNKINKKPFKVYRRPPLDLSSDTLHDILAFFDRKCLCRLQLVNSRFNQIIQREFATIPHYLFTNVSYSNRECHEYDCDKNRNYIGDRNVFDQILAAKCVRFDHSDVECDDQAILKHFLSINSNRMQTFSLKLSKNIKLTKFRARRLAKYKKCTSIWFHGRVALLPEFLLGNCGQLEMSDDLFTTADSASVPWAKILDFLFRPSRTKKRYCCIHIETLDAPNDAEYLVFTNLVSQRFSSATSSVFFVFTWLTNNSSVVDYVFDEIENTHTKQRLKQAKCFCKTYTRFDMYTDK